MPFYLQNSKTFHVEKPYLEWLMQSFSIFEDKDTVPKDFVLPGTFNSHTGKYKVMSEFLISILEFKIQESFISFKLLYIIRRFYIYYNNATIATVLFWSYYSFIFVPCFWPRLDMIFFNDSVYVVYKVESDLISKHIPEITVLAKTLILACLLFFSFALFIEVKCRMCTTWPTSLWNCLPVCKSYY